MNSEQKPSLDTLAALAAHFLPPCNDAASAAKQAADLWTACAAELAKTDEGSNEKFAETFRSLIAVPEPDQWPAGLNDFYQLVVRAKDETNNQPRFKRFLSWQIQREQQNKQNQQQETPVKEPVDFVRLQSGAQPPLPCVAEERLAHYQAHQFYEADWRLLAMGYLSWWKDEMTKAKVKAGQARQNRRKKNRKKTSSTY